MEMCQNEKFQYVEICKTADISTNTVLSTDCNQGKYKIEVAIRVDAGSSLLTMDVMRRNI